MQCHENSADKVPDDDSNATHQEGLAEERGRKRACDDGQYVDVGAQPEREQVTRFAVPLVERDLVNRVPFNTGRLLPAVRYWGIHLGWETLASIIGGQYSLKK
jgi:hypothetical protein